MRPEPDLRPASGADAPAVLSLLAAQLAEHRIAIDGDRLASAIAAVLSDGGLGRLLVAAVEGEIVGVAYVSFTFTLEHGGRVAWLEELYVTPSRRGRGIGRALLGRVLDLARSERCHAVDLEVDEDHQRVAALYERHGFEPLPRRRMSRRL